MDAESSTEPSKPKMAFTASKASNNRGHSMNVDQPSMKIGKKYNTNSQHSQDILEFQFKLNHHKPYDTQNFTSYD